MPRYTNAQFEKAIKGSAGIIATVANRLGCDWHTADTRISASKTLTRLMENEANTVDDMAESVVIKDIQSGDTKAAQWWLERRRRGKYSTRQEVTGAEGTALITTIEVVRTTAADDSDA